jgi:hypothetical protein
MTRRWSAQNRLYGSRYEPHPTAYVTCSPSSPLSTSGSRAVSSNSPLDATRSRSSEETRISPPLAHPLPPPDRVSQLHGPRPHRLVEALQLDLAAVTKRHKLRRPRAEKVLFIPLPLPHE